MTTMRKIKNNDRRCRRRWIFESLLLNAIARQLGRSILLPPRIYCVLWYVIIATTSILRRLEHRIDGRHGRCWPCVDIMVVARQPYRLNFQSNLVYPIRPFSRDPVRIQLDDGESNWIRIFELDSNWIPIVSRFRTIRVLCTRKPKTKFMVMQQRDHDHHH